MKEEEERKAKEAKEAKEKEEREAAQAQAQAEELRRQRMEADKQRLEEQRRKQEEREKKLEESRRKLEERKKQQEAERKAKELELQKQREKEKENDTNVNNGYNKPSTDTPSQTGLIKSIFKNPNDKIEPETQTTTKIEEPAPLKSVSALTTKPVLPKASKVSFKTARQSTPPKSKDIMQWDDDDDALAKSKFQSHKRNQSAKPSKKDIVNKKKHRKSK